MNLNEAHDLIDMLLDKVDQPYFNGSAVDTTFTATSGNDFFAIDGTFANTNWFQNKIGEVLSLYDSDGNGIITEAEIKEVHRDQFFDESAQYLVYINDLFSSSFAAEEGTSLAKVKRFHCNGYVDANKNVMDNAKELLANMRGIFLYIDGKYELSIEDTGTSTLSITDNHIIAESGIGVDYGNKDKKANKVIVEFFNANKKYELDTATVLHDASPYTADDGGEVLEVKAEFPLISDPYIAYNMAKAILTRSRNQTTMQFMGTPEMYKLNVGDIVDLTYAGLGFSGKVCRVEALELQSNGLVAVSLIEYFDVYTWEVPPQEAAEELANLPSAYAVKAPTGLSFTDSNSSSTGRPFLSWNEPTDFPDYQYRVNVVDSSNNQVTNKIVNTENCDLNFVKTGSNYVASVSSLNTLGVESSPATLTFTIGIKPVDGQVDVISETVDTLQIAADAVTNAKLAVDSIQGDVIAAGAITEQKFADDSITADKLKSNSVTTVKILARNIIAESIATDAVIARTIQTDAVTADKILADAVTATKINVSDLAAISADMGTITAGTISAGTVKATTLELNGTTLSADANGLKIAASGVSSGELGTRSVGSMVVNGASGSSSFGDGRSGDSFSSLIEATFTTAEAGDYQIVANCMVGGTINNLTQVESRTRIGSTVIADYSSPVGGNMLQPIILAGKVTLAAGTSYTAILEGQVIQDNPGVTPAISGFSTRISALKLNKQ